MPWARHSAGPSWPSLVPGWCVRSIDRASRVASTPLRVHAGASTPTETTGHFRSHPLAVPVAGSLPLDIGVASSAVYRTRATPRRVTKLCRESLRTSWQHRHPSQMLTIWPSVNRLDGRCYIGVARLRVCCKSPAARETFPSWVDFCNRLERCSGRGLRTENSDLRGIVAGTCDWRWQCGTEVRGRGVELHTDVATCQTLCQSDGRGTVPRDCSRRLGLGAACLCPEG